MNNEEFIAVIKDWLKEAGQLVLTRMQKNLSISTKSSRSDLVTNVDVEVQDFLSQKIMENFPQDEILGEESGKNTGADFSKRVWIIDPIDGTLNFVFQRENFAIMIGIFAEGHGQLGFIYDVRQEKLYWGGKNIGVYCNEIKLYAPKNLAANAGLWGMNARIYGQNLHGLREFVDHSMGVRIVGSAGMEFISLLKGQTIGYISKLYPWDYAAGMVLANELGLIIKPLNKKEIDFKGAEEFIIATSKASTEVFEYLKQRNNRN